MSIEKLDAVLLGYAVNQRSGGYDGKEYTFLETIDAKYLYHNCFLDTYCAEPMAFMQLIAQAEANGYRVEAFDGLILGYNKNDLKRVLLENDSLLYGFSIYESTLTDIFEVVAWLKKKRPKVKVFVGGPYATISAKYILDFCPSIDYVMVGDGDNAFPELIRHLKNNSPIEQVSNLYYRNGINNICSTKIKSVDLNTIVPPKRLYSNIIQERGYSFSISSSRGCGYANCAFCYLNGYQKIGNQPKYRFKNPYYVLDEIQELINTLNISKLSFCDEDFFGDKAGVERAIEILQLLIKRGIHLDLHVNARARTVMWLAKNGYLELCKKAGIKYMYVGLESYNDSSLELFDKGITTNDIDFVINELHRRQIRINPGLITFDPTLTIQQVKQNIDLFKKIKYYDAFIFTRRLVLYPNANPKIRNLFNSSSYFQHDDTKKLYDAMVKFRDAVFPLYIKLNKKILNKKSVKIIQDIHFQSFRLIYNALCNDPKYVDRTIETCIYNACAFIETIGNRN